MKLSFQEFCEARNNLFKAVGRDADGNPWQIVSEYPDEQGNVDAVCMIAGGGSAERIPIKMLKSLRKTYVQNGMRKTIDIPME